MSLTKDRANSRLQAIKTVEELRNLIKQLDVKGEGKTTILWSGVAGNYGKGDSGIISSKGVAGGMAAANSDLRNLAETEAAKFLDLDRSSKNYNRQLASKLESLFKNDPDGINQFLYGPESGNPPRRTGTGVWDEVSEKFVKQASGDVRLVVGGASLDRVFAQTEVQVLLDNPAIKSIEGVPIDALKDLQRVSGLSRVLQLLMGLSEANTGMIQIQVDSNGRPIQRADGSFRVDATDYMQMSVVSEKSPKGMRPMMDFIPDSRRLRHQEAVEEIFKLYPILRGKKYNLILDADPFDLPTALSRVSDYGGKAIDAVSLGAMLLKAGRELHAGDKRKAHNTITSWIAETVGGFSAGRLAALIVAPVMRSGPVGMLFGAGVIIGASIAGGDLTKRIFDMFRRLFDEINRMYSPLVLDLDGDGIETIDLRASHIQFDHDSNGFAEQTGWIHADDGFLVLDLNRNGKIDNGSELFGNHTLLSDGKLAENGFLALASYDVNLDGRIDRHDSVWSRLRVWKDQNGNGSTDSGELLQLSAAKVQTLLLAYTESTDVDSQGNAHRQKGFYEMVAGGSAALHDVWFATDSFNSRPLSQRTVPAAIAALPDLPGMGIVASLHQSLLDPANAALKQTLETWLKATRLQRVTLTQQLIFEWTNASQNPFATPQRRITSRDPLIQQKVAVIEKLNGQMLADSARMIGHLRADAIISMVDNLAFYVEKHLINQSLIKRLFNLAVSANGHEDGSAALDVTASVSHLRSVLRADPDPATIPMVHWLLCQFGAGGVDFFEALKSTSSTRADLLRLATRLQPSVASPWEWQKGTANDDNLQGSANDDFLEAGDGIDHLWGYAGNDSLHGGPGTDFYHGGPGGDTYYVSQNADLRFDVVEDEGLNDGNHVDRIVFWEVPSTSVTLSRNLNDVLFYSGGTIILSLVGQMVPENRIEEFHFSDGVTWTSHSLMLHLPVQGTHENDRLTGALDTSNRLQGQAGQDTLTGGLFPDHLEGGHGHDLLIGSGGPDTLDGGVGNDTLQGGDGGDRYLYAAHGGHDRLVEAGARSAEPDGVVLTGLRTTSVTRVQRDGSNLLLHFGASNSLLLVNQMDPNSRIESFQFANATWDHAALLAQVR
jgi:Ca2+-binding RTX toxin-like protein